MGTLYLDLPVEQVDEFLANGFDEVIGAHALHAVYDATLIDGAPHSDFQEGVRVAPHRIRAGTPSAAPQTISMPKPWPTIIGYDGMPRSNYVGIAMKADGARWVPVLEFDPPLSADERAAAAAAAEANHARRREEAS